MRHNQQSADERFLRLVQRELAEGRGVEDIAKKLKVTRPAIDQRLLRIGYKVSVTRELVEARPRVAL